MNGIFETSDCTCGVWMSVTPPPPCPVHSYVGGCRCHCRPPTYSVITTTTTGQENLKVQ